MEESTLSLSFAEFASRVCRQLGLNPTLASNSSDVQTHVGEIVNSGYRAFLYPLPLPGESHSHVWSFLKVTTTLATTSGDYDVDLPDTWGGIDGTFTYATTDNRCGPIIIVDENKIRELRESQSSTTGQPRFAAIRPKTGTAGTTGQRFEAIFWPTPDATYTLTYRYSILPAILSTASPYPLGGETHGETILAFCQQRAAEEDDDDPVKYANVAMQRLVASVKADRQKMSPEFFGYNGNRERKPYKPVPHGVTYNDVQYGLYS